MRIYTLNLRAGGGNRLARILASIEHHDADVLVLTEFRLGLSGEALIAQLERAGYTTHVHSDPLPRTNSVLLASRLPADTHALDLPHHRLVSAQIDGLIITGVYMPNTRPKLEFWLSHLQPALDSLVAHPAVIVGDFNTGEVRDRQMKQRFFAEANFIACLANGWTDAWRTVNGDALEYSWLSHTKNGFLLDHLWLSQPATHRLKHAYLSHDERLAGTSDHSALIVDLWGSEHESIP